MKIAKIPIELYGQSFAPLVPIYCMVLWLIQQPIPAPQQPCWGSQVTSKLMHDSLPGFLNPAPVAMVQWQSTSPSGIWYFSFATCFLIEVSHQQSPSTSDLRQISQQAAVEHKWLPAKIKTQGRHWTVRVQKSFFSWISYACKHEGIESCLGLWEWLGGMEDPLGLARQTLKNINKVILVYGAGWITIFLKWEKICKVRCMRITAHICTVQRHWQVFSFVDVAKKTQC